jgi:hypothetical protein
MDTSKLVRFAEVIQGNWRNDANNDQAQAVARAGCQSGADVHQMVRVGTATHQPVWVDVSIALWMLKYDPSIRPSRLI